MRIKSSLSENDFQELKREDIEVLGTGGSLFPPFGQGIKDYVEIHIHDKNKNFKEKIISEHTTFEDTKIKMNLGQELRDNGYDRGIFVCIYYFIRPVAGADDIILTKTLNGVSGIVHTGDPQLTGIDSTGNFYLDDDNNPFLGVAPPVEGEPKPLDVKEWKYKIDEISTSRTEIRVVPQIISNVKYKDDFRKIIDNTIKYIPETAWDNYIDANPDLLNAWNDIQGNVGYTAEWWRPRLDYQDGITSKKDFGKLHYTMYGFNENRNEDPGDGGGQISWTGPDSARLEFNVRRESEDEGFQPYMQGGTLVVRDAYVVGEEIVRTSFENDNYTPEDPIPDTHIEVTESPTNPRTRIFTMMLRNREGESNLDDLGAEFNTNSQQVQYFWEFGCGHSEGPTTEHQVEHTFDEDGSFVPTCLIMTPNFDSNVTSVKTITGKDLQPVLIQTPVDLTINEDGEAVDVELPGPPPQLEYIPDGSIITYWGSFWLIDKGRKRFIVSYGTGSPGPENGLEFDSLPVGINNNGEFHYSAGAQETLLALYESKGIATAKPEWSAWRSLPGDNNKRRLRDDGTEGGDDAIQFRFPSGKDTDELLHTYSILHTPSFLVKVTSAVKNAIPDGPVFREADFGATESTADGPPEPFTGVSSPFWPSNRNQSGGVLVQVTVISIMGAQNDARQGVGFILNEDNETTNLGSSSNPTTGETITVPANSDVILTRTAYGGAGAMNQQFRGWSTEATYNNNNPNIITLDHDVTITAPSEGQAFYYAHSLDED